MKECLEDVSAEINRIIPEGIIGAISSGYLENYPKKTARTELEQLGASGVIRTVEAKRTPFVFQGLSVLEL